MRLFGREFGWGAGATKSGGARGAVTSRPADPKGRPSWYWFVDPRGHSQAIIPIEKDLGVYDDMRRLFPIIDAAIDKTVRFCGGLDVEASTKTANDLRDWMERVQVNQTQRGLETWLGTHLDQLLMYGKSVGEIVPNTRRDDVYALTNLEARTILLRAGDTPLELRVLQRQMGPNLYAELTPGWYLHSMHRPRGDNPHGTSVLRSLTAVCETLSIANNAMNLVWEREGAPSFHLNWKPDPGFVDPDGSLASQVTANLGAQLAAIMAARRTGDVQDLTTSGEVAITTIGQDHTPVFTPDAYRIYAEQIVCALGLPAWMLGLHWSTTERLSSVQAEVLLAEFAAIRRDVEPQLAYLLDLRQRLTGRSGRFKLKWKPITLTDLTETARGESIVETARSQRIERAVRMWQLGYWTQDRAGLEVDPDFTEPVVRLDQPPPPLVPAHGVSVPSSTPQ